MVLLDELPLVSLLNSQGQVDERVYPNFAQARRDQPLVPQRHGRRLVHVVRRAEHAVGALAGEEARAVLHPASRQPLLVPRSATTGSGPSRRSPSSATRPCAPTPSPAGGDLGLRGLFGQTWQVAKTLAKPYDDDGPVSDQFAEKSAGTVTTSKKGAETMTAPKWKTLKANQPDRFQRFLAGLRPRDKPTLNFLHLLLPHHPWRYLPSGATHPGQAARGPQGRVGEPGLADGREPAGAAPAAGVHRPPARRGHRPPREARASGTTPLVVVTADHGEGFIPGGAGRRATDEPESQAQVAWVPMFLKEPGQSKGTISDANWEHVDLLPTMADALDRKLPFKVDGISQLSGTRERSEKYLVQLARPAHRLPLGAGLRAGQGRRHGHLRGRRRRPGRAVHGGQPAGVDRQEGVEPDAPSASTWTVRQSPMTARLSSGPRLRRGRPVERQRPVVGDRHACSTRRAAASSSSRSTAPSPPCRRSTREAKKPSFAGFVNDALFTAGKNDLALYEVVGDADPELRPVALR